MTPAVLTINAAVTFLLVLSVKVVGLTVMPARSPPQPFEEVLGGRVGLNGDGGAACP